MSADQRPRKFDRWSDLWQRYHDWIATTGLSPLQVCVAFVSAIPQVQQVVVGVNGLSHIKEIVQAQTNLSLYWPPELATDDETLLNPLAWLKLP